MLLPHSSSASVRPKMVFSGHALRLRELLQRFHGAHDFLRRGVQFQSHAPPAFPEAADRLAHFQRQDRDVVGLRRAVGKGADFPEQSRGDGRRGLAGQRAGVGEQPLVAVTFLLRIERLAHAVGVKHQRVTGAQRQFRALEFQAGFEAQRRAEILDRPARRFAGGGAAPDGNGRRWPG